MVAGTSKFLFFTGGCEQRAKHVCSMKSVWVKYLKQTDIKFWKSQSQESVCEHERMFNIIVGLWNEEGKVTVTFCTVGRPTLHSICYWLDHAACSKHWSPEKNVAKFPMTQILAWQQTANDQKYIWGIKIPAIDFAHYEPGSFTSWSLCDHAQHRLWQWWRWSWWRQHSLHFETLTEIPALATLPNRSSKCGCSSLDMAVISSVSLWVPPPGERFSTWLSLNYSPVIVQQSWDVEVQFKEFHSRITVKPVLENGGEREREKSGLICIYLFIYIYIYFPFLLRMWSSPLRAQLRAHGRKLVLSGFSGA